MAEQATLLLERQRKDGARCCARTVATKQLDCGVPTSLGDQVAQFWDWLTHNGRNSLLQICSAAVNAALLSAP
jgi:hypothetical protein